MLEGEAQIKYSVNKWQEHTSNCLDEEITITIIVC